MNYCAKHKQCYNLVPLQFPWTSCSECQKDKKKQTWITWIWPFSKWSLWSPNGVNYIQRRYTIIAFNQDKWGLYFFRPAKEGDDGLTTKKAAQIGTSRGE